MGQRRETALSRYWHCFRVLQKHLMTTWSRTNPGTLYVTMCSNPVHCGSTLQRGDAGARSSSRGFPSYTRFTVYDRAIIRGPWPSCGCPPPLTVVTFLRMHTCIHPCLEEKLAVAERLLARQRLVEEVRGRVQRLSGFN